MYVSVCVCFTFQCVYVSYFQSIFRVQVFLFPFFSHIFKTLYHREEGADANPEEEQHKVLVVEFWGEGSGGKKEGGRVGVGEKGEKGKVIGYVRRGGRGDE